MRFSFSLMPIVSQNLTGGWKICHHILTKNINFVLGYGGYLRKKGLLNKYIRYDSMTIAMQYLGMAIRGLPYMGVGRTWHTDDQYFSGIKDLVRIIML